MQIGNLIPDLHKNATFSGLQQFAPGPAFFQNAVGQADCYRAGVAGLKVPWFDGEVIFLFSSLNGYEGGIIVLV